MPHLLLKSHRFRHLLKWETLQKLKFMFCISKLIFCCCCLDVKCITTNFQFSLLNGFYATIILKILTVQTRFSMKMRQFFNYRLLRVFSHGKKKSLDEIRILKMHNRKPVWLQISPTPVVRLRQSKRPNQNSCLHLSFDHIYCSTTLKLLSPKNFFLLLLPFFFSLFSGNGPLTLVLDGDGWLQGHMGPVPKWCLMVQNFRLN